VPEPSAHAWRTTLKRRLAVAGGVFLLWSAAIEARLIYFQIVEHEALVAAAERQQLRTIDAPAKRGELVDRQGRLLAYSVDADTVYAVPNDIGDPARAAVLLCDALGDCSRKDRDALAERLRSDRHFEYVRRRASPEQARRIAALDLEGIGFMKEDRRYYPNRELAAHLLGYVGVDNVGLGGIEERYDDLIGGEPGKVLVQTDARRHAFSRVERPATTGDTLELTIDRTLQHVTERELKVGVQWAGGMGGAAIVMDPATGEILAMASYPAFNPNAYGDFKPDARRNRAVQDAYEPGSTFKIITASAALEEKVVTPDVPVDVSAGAISFPGRSRPIRDDHRYGVLSFRDVIAKSSNVGAIKVGLKVGRERFLEYMKRFGFGRRLSPDFSGENAGLLWTPKSDSALASMLMGYEVSVTPLQMAAALSSIANGGELVQPRVVRAVVRGGERLVVPRNVIGRTVSERTAAEMRTILEAVVEPGGTATRARVEGYTVAGKTGTSKKIIDGSYQGHNDYTVSFAGFAPSREPLFTIVVVVDSPRAAGVSRYGGIVAAPIFQRIADAALRQRGVPPSLNPAPPVLVARRDEPLERQALAQGEPLSITRIAPTTGGAEPAFPDLVGLSARDAVRVLARLGMSPRLHGAGVVVQQRPAAGTPMDASTVATLWLERHPRSQVADSTGR
jgi:cell division protein FtsI (penicillin-binding protein 3)